MEYGKNIKFIYLRYYKEFSGIKIIKEKKNSIKSSRSVFIENIWNPFNKVNSNIDKKKIVQDVARWC